VEDPSGRAWREFKTWANIRSSFGRVLELAGVIDRMGMGIALRHSMWGPLMKAVAHDKRLSNGLAAFANWCAARGIAPEQVDDHVLREFHAWLEDRTLCPKPCDVVRRVPHLWNELSEKFEIWPKIKLTTLSFKAPFKRHQWGELSESFRKDVEAYLATRQRLVQKRPVRSLRVDRLCPPVGAHASCPLFPRKDAAPPSCDEPIDAAQFQLSTRTSFRLRNLLGQKGS
jgi:hypothetical protein